MNKNKLVYIVFLLLTVVIPFSCVEEEAPVLPYVRVDFSINLLTQPDLLYGGVPLMCRNVGYQGNGIIIVPIGYGDMEFRAYDATCTRDISEETTAVEVDKNKLATCPRCKTVYNLLTGYAVNQNFHLQEYAVRRDGYDRLHITTY